MTLIRMVDTSKFMAKQDAADMLNKDILETYKKANLKNTDTKFASKESVLVSLSKFSIEQSFTHYKALDDKIKFPSSGVVVIAGRPGHGKSSLMRNIALRKVLRGEKVVYLTYEFSQDEEVLNFAHALTGNPSPKAAVLAGGDLGFNAISGHLGSNLFVSHEIRTIEEIQATLSTEGLAGASVFIDYIQKIPSSSFKGDTSGSEAQIRHVCNILNDIAISNNILIITGSQLTQSSGGSPVQDNVKGAKAIEEVASVLLRIWRHGVNESSMLHDMLFKINGSNFTIDVLKNRRGVSSSRVGLYTHNGLTLRDKSELEDLNSEFLLEQPEASHDE